MAHRADNAISHPDSAGTLSTPYPNPTSSFQFRNCMLTTPSAVARTRWVMTRPPPPSPRQRPARWRLPSPLQGLHGQPRSPPAPTPPQPQQLHPEPRLLEPALTGSLSVNTKPTNQCKRINERNRRRSLGRAARSGVLISGVYCGSSPQLISQLHKSSCSGKVSQLRSK